MRAPPLAELIAAPAVVVMMVSVITLIVIVIVIAVGLSVGIVILVIVVMLNTVVVMWCERKWMAHLMSRMGPMRTGWHGAMQPFADALKLLGKEDRTHAPFAQSAKKTKTTRESSGKLRLGLRDLGSERCAVSWTEGKIVRVSLLASWAGLH